MIRKIITISLLMIIISIISQAALAQRGIDPMLQPKNIPGLPVTGSSCPLDKLQKDCNICTCTDETANEDCPTKKFDATTGLCLSAETSDEPIVAFLQVLAGALLMISGAVAVIVISVGGVMYITSHGNQQQIDNAKNTLVYGILGILIIIFSYFIVSLIITIVVQQSLT